jgi:CheY-like chemotaxis protein
VELLDLIRQGDSPVHHRDHDTKSADERDLGSRGSILVADDDENNRALIVRNLVRRGYQVTEARDGEQALQLVREHPFDLLLCDVVMPEMDGVELLRRVRSEVSQSLPVVVISALDQMDTVEKCLDLDATDFISKPFEPAVLLAKVRAIIRRQSRSL